MSRLATNVVSVENSVDTFIKSEDLPTINNDENEDTESLSCLECNVDFVDRYSLNQHLLFHIKQPVVILTPLKNPPIKITLKSTSKDSFEVVSSPVTSPLTSPTHLPKLAEQEQEHDEAAEAEDTQETEDTNIAFSPNYVNGVESPTVNSENSNSSTMKLVEGECDQLTLEADEGGEEEEYSNIPGAEPTPPPEPSPEYPKIRIKTTGLLRESLTITEITDENPEGRHTQPEIIEIGSKEDAAQGSSGFCSNQCDEGNMWTSSLEDPLRIPESSEKDDGNLLALFGDNNERVKDLGFTSSESEFISLDRLDDRNRNAMQVYNSNIVTPTSNQNPLDSLTGLPMQQLAQQVSRLQPNSGTHQQNVLINIQHFPQAPPQGPTHGYQPPPMYHHAPQPTMYQPYQYQPPNHMYYPPAPGYPPHMPPPPPPQMSQGPHQQQMPNQQQMQPPMQQPQYRPPMPQRQTAPVIRQQAPGTRPHMQRQPMPRQAGPVRHRAIAPRPRVPMTNVRGPRPRMPMPNAQQVQNPQQRMAKRTAEQIQALQKRKRVDVLLPDKNEDPDCQVVCMQPKNTGLPQIQSVQGATQDPSDGNVMHLSDSITLSVRNQPPKSNSPKKSDAKAVANILATRGITVTATAKAKEKTEATSKGSPPPPPVAINLNSAVSIIPAAKNGNTKTSQQSDSKLPTVDLTDDTASEHRPQPPPKPTQPVQRPLQRRGLPYRCDLCAAQYPTMLELTKHKQGYHKTNGTCEIGVPLIDLKMPGVVQKLSSLGIFNYIPLPGAGSQGMFGIPVINARNAANASVIGASSILTLGPIRTIPRTQQSPNVNKTHPGAK